MILRDYQNRAIGGLRDAFREKVKTEITPGGLAEERPTRSVLLQLATGGGKTPIVTSIVHNAMGLAAKRDAVFRVWFIVPRNELLDQASAHFAKWGIKHALIAAGTEESRAFQVHVVSKDTLLRRLERIKNWPDLLIFDEAHIAFDAQLKIIAHCPPTTKILGVSATPERLDGRGLWSGSGGPYDSIVYGPSIPWLTEHEFLSPLKYYAPPMEGLADISRRGLFLDPDELKEFMKRKKVYGKVVDHYRMLAPGKPALIFCNSVEEAYEVAEEFTHAGFKFFCIEGTMTDSRRRSLIAGLRSGEIDGLTNCEIATYGLDVPRVEYGASLRWTLSRALYMQMVGRILRPYEGKEFATFVDHANLVQEHQDPSSPGVPLFYLDNLEWNFAGTERRKRAKGDAPQMRSCPAVAGFQYCGKSACRSACALMANPDGGTPEPLVIETALEQRKPPESFTDAPEEEKRAMQDAVARAAEKAVEALEDGHIASGPIGELLKLATKMKRNSMWVYWYLMGALESKIQKKVRSVNIPLLREIQRQKGYLDGWVHLTRKEIEKALVERDQGKRELQGALM